MTYSTIEWIGILSCFFSVQFASSLSLFLLERAMISYYYIFGTYEKPSNLCEKTVNFCMYAMMGAGFYIYLRLRKYNWFVRKFFFLIALIIQGIASIIIYKIIYGIIKAIFL